jgi:hypothetical protein
MSIGLHVKYLLFSSDFSETSIFSDSFSKNIQISNFMEIRLLETEFHADGRTDMSNLIVDFRNFTDAPKTIFEHS